MSQISEQMQTKSLTIDLSKGFSKKPITKTIKRPIIDRYSIISKVFKLVASSRPETAIRLNDTIAPIIQTVAFSGSDLVVMIESSGAV